MPYSKVLVPVGGENILERGQKALSHAIPLCAGEIILLNVLDPLPGTVGGEAREAMLREEHASAEKALQPLLDTVADTIVRIAHEQESDIIVMFTDGRDDVSSLLIGSITERVLRNTDTPLLAVRR